MKNYYVVSIGIGSLVAFGALLNYAFGKGIEAGKNLGYIEGYLKCVADGKSDEESSASKS